MKEKNSKAAASAIIQEFYNGNAIISHNVDFDDLNGAEVIQNCCTSDGINFFLKTSKAVYLLNTCDVAEIVDREKIRRNLEGALSFVKNCDDGAFDIEDLPAVAEKLLALVNGGNDATQNLRFMKSPKIKKAC